MDSVCSSQDKMATVAGGSHPAGNKESKGTFAAPLRIPPGLAQVKSVSPELMSVLQVVEDARLWPHRAVPWRLKGIATNSLPHRGPRWEAFLRQRSIFSKEQGADSEVYNGFAIEGTTELLDSFNKKFRKSLLGGGTGGTRLWRHSDVCLDFAFDNGLESPLELVVYKFMYGKCREVKLNYAGAAQPPTPGHHSHVPADKPDPSASLFANANNTQVYLYELNGESIYPKHCIPYAKVRYVRDASRIPQSANLQRESLQKVTPMRTTATVNSISKQSELLLVGSPLAQSSRYIKSIDLAEVDENKEPLGVETSKQSQRDYMSMELVARGEDTNNNNTSLTSPRSKKDQCIFDYDAEESICRLEEETSVFEEDIVVSDASPDMSDSCRGYRAVCSIIDLDDKTTRLDESIAFEDRKPFVEILVDWSDEDCDEDNGGQASLADLSSALNQEKEVLVITGKCGSSSFDDRMEDSREECVLQEDTETELPINVETHKSSESSEVSGGYTPTGHCGGDGFKEVSLKGSLRSEEMTVAPVGRYFADDKVVVDPVCNLETVSNHFALSQAPPGEDLCMELLEAPPNASGICVNECMSHVEPSSYDTSHAEEARLASAITASDYTTPNLPHSHFVVAIEQSNLKAPDSNQESHTVVIETDLGPETAENDGKNTSSRTNVKQYEESMQCLETTLKNTSEPLVQQSVQEPVPTGDDESGGDALPEGSVGSRATPVYMKTENVWADVEIGAGGQRSLVADSDEDCGLMDATIIGSVCNALRDSEEISGLMHANIIGIVRNAPTVVESIVKREIVTTFDNDGVVPDQSTKAVSIKIEDSSSMKDIQRFTQLELEDMNSSSTKSIPHGESTPISLNVHPQIPTATERQTMKHEHSRNHDSRRQIAKINDSGSDQHEGLEQNEAVDTSDSKDFQISGQQEETRKDRTVATCDVKKVPISDHRGRQEEDQTPDDSFVEKATLVEIYGKTNTKGSNTDCRGCNWPRSNSGEIAEDAIKGRMLADSKRHSRKGAGNAAGAISGEKAEGGMFKLRETLFRKELENWYSKVLFSGVELPPEPCIPTILRCDDGRDLTKPPVVKMHQRSKRNESTTSGTGAEEAARGKKPVDVRKLETTKKEEKNGPVKREAVKDQQKHSRGNGYMIQASDVNEVLANNHGKRSVSSNRINDQKTPGFSLNVDDHTNHRPNPSHKHNSSVTSNHKGETDVVCVKKPSSRKRTSVSSGNKLDTEEFTKERSFSKRIKREGANLPPPTKAKKLTPSTKPATSSTCSKAPETNQTSNRKHDKETANTEKKDPAKTSKRPRGKSHTPKKEPITLMEWKLLKIESHPPDKGSLEVSTIQDALGVHMLARKNVTPRVIPLSPVLEVSKIQDAPGVRMLARKNVTPRVIPLSPDPAVSGGTKNEVPVDPRPGHHCQNAPSTMDIFNTLVAFGTAIEELEGTVVERPCELDTVDEGDVFSNRKSYPTGHKQAKYKEDLEKEKGVGNQFKAEDCFGFCVEDMHNDISFDDVILTQGGSSPLMTFEKDVCFHESSKQPERADIDLETKVEESEGVDFDGFCLEGRENDTSVDDLAFTQDRSSPVVPFDTDTCLHASSEEFEPVDMDLETTVEEGGGVDWLCNDDMDLDSSAPSPAAFVETSGTEEDPLEMYNQLDTDKEMYSEEHTGLQLTDIKPTSLCDDDWYADIGDLLESELLEDEPAPQDRVTEDEPAPQDRVTSLKHVHPVGDSSSPTTILTTTNNTHQHQQCNTLKTVDKSRVIDSHRAAKSDTNDPMTREPEEDFKSFPTGVDLEYSLKDGGVLPISRKPDEMPELMGVGREDYELSEEVLDKTMQTGKGRETYLSNIHGVTIGKGRKCVNGCDSPRDTHEHYERECLPMVVNDEDNKRSVATTSSKKGTSTKESSGLYSPLLITINTDNCIDGDHGRLRSFPPDAKDGCQTAQELERRSPESHTKSGVVHGRRWSFSPVAQDRCKTAQDQDNISPESHSKPGVVHGRRWPFSPVAQDRCKTAQDQDHRSPESQTKTGVAHGRRWSFSPVAQDRCKTAQDQDHRSPESHTKTGVVHGRRWSFSPVAQDRCKTVQDQDHRSPESQTKPKVVHRKRWSFSSVARDGCKPELDRTPPKAKTKPIVVHKVGTRHNGTVKTLQKRHHESSDHKTTKNIDGSVTDHKNNSKTQDGSTHEDSGQLKNYTQQERYNAPRPRSKSPTSWSRRRGRYRSPTYWRPRSKSPRSRRRTQGKWESAGSWRRERSKSTERMRRDRSRSPERHTRTWVDLRSRTRTRTRSRSPGYHYRPSSKAGGDARSFLRTRSRSRSPTRRTRKGYYEDRDRDAPKSDTSMLKHATTTQYCASPVSAGSLSDIDSDSTMSSGRGSSISSPDRLSTFHDVNTRTRSPERYPNSSSASRQINTRGCETFDSSRGCWSRLGDASNGTSRSRLRVSRWDQAVNEFLYGCSST